jgi:8-oxo-dGTP pyrophosphatase MutT (NUDIX family)
MFTPRILFKTSFPIAGMRVAICNREWAATPEYDALVDAEWKNMLDRAKHPIWDGTYYCVLNLNELGNGATTESLRLGTIRYRYIATFPALHAHHFRLHLDPLNHLSTIALIRTHDDHYVFGKRVRNGSVDLIGGGVQSDEIAISNGADVERNLYKEINEEVGIRSEDIVEMPGIGVLLSGTSNVLIVGHAHVDLSKAEAGLRFERREENEMTEPVFVPAAEVRKFLESMEDYRCLIRNLL